MLAQPRKLSEILKEMSERLLRKPAGVPSSEAAHVALMFANIAWNETVGLGSARKSYRSAWEMIEAENPQMWSEFKSTDVDGMIDELVRFKNAALPRGPATNSHVRHPGRQSASGMVGCRSSRRRFAMGDAVVRAGAD